LTAKEPEENSAESAAVFRLTPAALLPAVCPACGAPGTRPHTLKVSEHGSPEAELDAYYCDLCADEQNARTTRSLAWVGALCLLVLGGTTAAALALGTRALALQLSVPLVLGGLLPALVLRSAPIFRFKEPIELSSDKEGLLLSVRSKTYRRVLLEHGLHEANLREENLNEAGRAAGRHTPLLHRPPFFIGLIGLVWLVVLHSLGGAEVRVFVSGREKAVLLVDTRHFGKVAPTNAEDPRAGESVRVLGGRRHLELISESGALLGGSTITLWPGRTYIVGQVPPGKCFFWERREYGNGSGQSLLYPVSGDGPIWELREQVDSWFIPLDSSASDAEAETVQWETRGGIRRAIRLLPCRAHPR
jgi:hypothetical protein